MPVTTADVPSADKPEPKAKPAPAAKSGLAEAAKSADPLVQKLLWDRGHAESAGDTDFAHVAPDANDQRIAAIDAELRKLGFDI
jgi:hypothetical protein